MNERRLLERTHILWAFACLSLALMPHAGRFSVWMLVCFGALAAWRIAGDFHLLPLPDRRHPLLWIVKQALAVAAFVAIYITYQGQLGRDAGIALLTALLGLKLLELRDERDYYVVMFLAYFLVVTNFFYSQTLVTAGFMLLIVVAVTTGLVRFNTARDTLSTPACIRLAAVYCAQAIPLMAVAFVLFPRIPGPLWGLPQSESAAVTGLSDDMTIGHITELGVSDDIAFRVAFHGEPPPARELYWRGPVMWHTDGRRWTASRTGDGPAHPVTVSGPAYRYDVTLEAHEHRWLFGIEAVSDVGDAAREMSDARLLAKEPVRRRVRYSLTSHTQYERLAITPNERRAALQLPHGQHPLARTLAREWRDKHAADTDAIVSTALRYFNEQLFSYTLTPRRLTGDTVDEFLFTTREGFCEHYAAAFVTLMRAADIPARVVTGYQGGEFNSVSDYMIVRQRDAHAWAEVYDETRGWRRVDPTAAVAPERVSQGINRALPQDALLPLLGVDSAAGDLWRRATNVWDAVNYNWSQWVLGYTPKRQRQLLDDAGLEDWDYANLILALTLASTALMLFVALIVLRRRAGAIDPVIAAYAVFCRKLARAGLPRATHEGPLDYARRVAQTRADLAGEVLAITDAYIALRYANKEHPVAGLSRRIRAFSTKRAA